MRDNLKEGSVHVLENEVYGVRGIAYEFVQANNVFMCGKVKKGLEFTVLDGPGPREVAL